MHSKKIKIISHESQLSEDVIRQLLELPETSLSHGETFTGKPSTRLYVNDSYVLKGRNDLNFADEKLAYFWAQKRFSKEVETKLYHPQKTWFIEQTEKGWTVSSISPRLLPLHVAFEQPQCSTQDKLQHLSTLTQLYLSYGATFNERLDEGLSNFGLDQNNNLYYLDDDFYQWDHLLSFANMVALWVRLFSSTWLDNKAAQTLGVSIKQQIQTLFSEHHGVDYVAAFPVHLKQQFFNDIGKERVQHICNEVDSTHTNHATQPSPFMLKAAEVISNNPIEAWINQQVPIAIISDIHANLPAFDAVLDDIKKEGIQNIVCLGDVVGYGPHPSECIQRLQDLDAFVIRGNHDHMVGSGKDFSHGSRSSLHVATWTMDKIDELERTWLKGLPLQFRNQDMMFVHGAPRDATFFNAYVYERTAEPNLKWMEEHNLPLCFHGHSHLQGLYALQARQITLHKELKTYALEKHTCSLICPGAVGQPRSGNPGAEYAIYDPHKQEVTFKRLDYDIDSVTNDMIKYYFPEQLVTRLKEGF